MNDEVVIHSIDVIGGYGPVWVVLVLILVALVAIVILLVPAIKKRLENNDEIRKREQDLKEAHEQRKHDEFVERSERDGQLILLLQESNATIERNTRAFEKVMTELEKMDTREKHMEETVCDVRDSVKELDESVDALRLDIARIGGIEKNA